MKIRVEVTYDDGTKTSLDLEGSLPKSKAIEKVVHFLNTELSSHAPSISYSIDELTIKERLEFFLRYDERAPKDWFTTSDVKRKYEEVYGTSIKLSTISTYLTRLHNEGILERRGSKFKREYRVASSYKRAEKSEFETKYSSSIPR
ncbi:MAG: hypothetical protein OD814_000663 [Candidatus Alkanophagales archaeon MCA70_species_1]|nr:hypothetical protein [Candidatus Alkanophaga volatiphilum]